MMQPIIDPAIINRMGIAATERLIRPYIRHTPVIRIDSGDLGIAGEPLVLKLELLQHTGSFKPRGAFANLLTQTAPEAGIVAASGGNHGAAVAYAAMRLGLRATIFVPTVASPAKLERIRFYGAELVVGGERIPMRSRRAKRSPHAPVRCRSTPTTSQRLCSGRDRSGWRSRPTRRTSTRCWSRSAAAGSSAESPLGTKAGSASSRSSRNWPRPCTTRSQPEGRSMHQPAESPPIRWRRARSAR
jgi:pyridoxal-phosphate dependent enzyme